MKFSVSLNRFDLVKTTLDGGGPVVRGRMEREEAGEASTEEQP